MWLFCMRYGKKAKRIPSHLKNKVGHAGENHARIYPKRDTNGMSKKNVPCFKRACIEMPRRWGQDVRRDCD